MTVEQVLQAHRTQNPGSPYDEGVLTQMLTGLEQMVQVELLRSFPFVHKMEAGVLREEPGALVQYTWPADGQSVLLLTDTPFVDIYGLYCNAMCFFRSGEWTKYENAKSLFNARYTDALSYYSRTREHLPRRVMYAHW